MWQLWLISAGLFFVLEIATTGFLVFWFGIGCLFAMVTSFFTDNVLLILPFLLFIRLVYNYLIENF